MEICRKRAGRISDETLILLWSIWICCFRWAFSYWSSKCRCREQCRIRGFRHIPIGRDTLWGHHCKVAVGSRSKCFRGCRRDAHWGRVLLYAKLRGMRGSSLWCTSRYTSTVLQTCQQNGFDLTAMPEHISCTKYDPIPHCVYSRWPVDACPQPSYYTFFCMFYHREVAGVDELHETRSKTASAWFD